MIVHVFPHEIGRRGLHDSPQCIPGGRGGRGTITAPPAASPDRAASRALINGSVWSLADVEPADVQTDHDRLARLMQLVGFVATTFLRGDRPLEDDLMRVAGCVLAWIEALDTERSA